MKDAFDEWLARVVCYAFSLPPTAFTAQVNRATAENAQDVALAEGLAPLQMWVKHLIDRVLAEEFAAPDLEFAWDADSDADPSATATIATDYVKTGIKSINEVRAELGLPPVAGGEQPKIQTAQGLMPLTASASAPAASSAGTGEKLQRYNQNHYGPGANGGQFAPSGAGSNGGTQVAQGDDKEEEETGPAASIRQAAYDSLHQKLSLIDPSNAALPIAHSPGWVPSPDDLANIQGALDDAIVDNAADDAAHALNNRTIDSNEFLDVGNDAQLQLLAQDVMKTSPAELAPRNRVFFYQSSTNTLVIINRDDRSQSTIFRPDGGRAFVDRQLNDK